MSYSDEYLESALEFIREGLACADSALGSKIDQKWRFAFIHLVTAFEHLAKHRLSLIHPVLVREKIQSQAKTVSVAEAVRRLRDPEISGDILKTNDERMINTIIKVRNQIIHGKPDQRSPFSNYKFFELFAFLRHYSLKHLNLSLDDLVVQTELPHFIVSTQQARENLKRAQLETKNENELWVCNACGQRFLHRIGETLVCSLCHEEDTYEACPRCGKDAPCSSIEPISDHYVHWEYWDFIELLEGAGIAETSCQSCRRDHAREVEDALTQFQYEEWESDFFFDEQSNPFEKASF